VLVAGVTIFRGTMNGDFAITTAKQVPDSTVLPIVAAAKAFGSGTRALKVRIR
jgi:hypothetical protein